MLSKYVSPSAVSIRRSENLFRQCRLLSQAAAAEPPAKSNEPNRATNTPNADAEDDKLYKRLELELRGTDPAVMESFTTFAVTAAKHLNIEVGRW